jgi:hypothetical protein
MKKIIAFLGIILMLSLFLQAQEVTKLTNKKGVVIQPEAGDWCLGISATPFLDYVGNLLKLSTEQNISPTFGFTAQNPGIIWGKLMQTDTRAIRIGLIIGINVNVDNEPDAIINSETNQYKTSALSIGMSLGIEKYKTIKSRLIGIYGFEGGVLILPYRGLSRNSNNFVVGSYTFDNPNDNSENFVEKGGNQFSLNGRAFVGVEYFVAPKVSLSGEFGLGLGFYYSTERKYEPEFGSNEIIKASSYGLDLSPQASGDLVLRIYF